MLTCVSAIGRELGIVALPDWCEQHRQLNAPTKSDQDLLDGVLCALIGYIWLFEARSRSLMIGDAEAGYIISPAVDEARIRLQSAAALRGVRCR